MFRLQPDPTFKARVSLSVPGHAKKAEIGIEFRHLSRSQIEAFFESCRGGRTDADALGEIIVGWSDVDTAYSSEALAQLVDNYPLAAQELFDAFRREALQAREKN